MLKRATFITFITLVSFIIIMSMPTFAMALYDSALNNNTAVSANAGAAQSGNLVVDKTVTNTADTDIGCVSTVTLTVEAVGTSEVQSAAVDNMLLIDNSGSMAGQPLKDAQAAASTLVDNMNLGADQVGVAHFETTAGLDQQLTTDGTAAKNAINALTTGGLTNMAAGINVAQAELTGPRHKAGNLPVITMLSDGNPTAGGDATAAANAAKAAGTRIITIGLGLGIDEALLRNIASSPSDYYYAPDSSELQGIFQKISTRLGSIVATNVVVKDVLSSLAELVPGSPTIAPTDINGKELTWEVGTMSIGDIWTVSFQIIQEQAGLSNVVDESKVTYNDPQGNPVEQLFPKAECLGCNPFSPDPGPGPTTEPAPLPVPVPDVTPVTLSANVLPSTGAAVMVFAILSLILMAAGCGIIKTRKSAS